jgi:hypothetical protein
MLSTVLGARELSEASRSKLRIVALLYFIGGSPVSVLWEVLPVYGPYFAFTFLVSIPGRVLVPFVASWLPARPGHRAAQPIGE